MDWNGDRVTEMYLQVKLLKYVDFKIVTKTEQTWADPSYEADTIWASLWKLQDNPVILLLWPSNRHIVSVTYFTSLVSVSRSVGKQNYMAQYLKLNCNKRYHSSQLHLWHANIPRCKCMAIWVNGSILQDMYEVVKFYILPTSNILPSWIDCDAHLGCSASQQQI